MGLWRSTLQGQYFDAAVVEAKATLDAGCPNGADVIARFCLARQKLRDIDAEPSKVIEAFLEETGSDAAPALVTASLLALDAGERRLHERYRRAFLDKHAENPQMWTATAFLVDRYQRYWMYHAPFVAGWTYGRRQGYFLASGTPEDAVRTFQAELKTLDGDSVTFPKAADGKWTVIEFAPSAEGGRHIQRYTNFIDSRPQDDVQLFAAILNDDAEAVRKTLQEKKSPDKFPTLLVPEGLENPLVRQLGILPDEKKTNLLILRPDGGIAAAISSLALHGNVIESVIQWHDEKAVDEAIAKGDLDTAKRLAFALAPVEQQPPPNAPRNWKPKPIAVPHLRSRAKVYMAMKDWEAAFDDIQAVYLQVNSKAGYLSMRTEELAGTEKLKATIVNARHKLQAEK